MPHKDVSQKNTYVRNSISHKYGVGYILLLLVMLIVFAVSFASGAIVTKQYDTAINDLLRLNELFAEVETTNKYLYDCVIYLRADSLENCEKSRKIAQKAVDKVFVTLEKEYMRDVMDLNCTVQTYLNQNEALTDKLRAYREGESIENNSAVQKMYNESLNTISYINQSFKNIYSEKLVSTKELQSKIQTMRLAFNLLEFVFVLVSLGLFFLFYRQVVNGLTHSVKKLTDFANKITENPMTKEHIVLQTDDELEVFGNGFNHMVDTIQNQFEQIREDQRVHEQLQKAEIENIRISSALQNSQLKLLQSRINPHFLFNTLNMILQTAYTEEAEETAHLMEATADFLRYNLDKVTKAVTLGDELANVRDYVEIQRCRFGKRIYYGFEVDDACMAQAIPCMIVQPLLENSIKYGVGMMPSGGKITVRIYQKDCRCYIEVEDNGEGIAEEKLEKLRLSIADRTLPSESIGLRNVYLRLMLYFNDDVDFTISSEPGRTCVHIGIPRLPSTSS